jgi:hypothetical protein
LSSPAAAVLLISKSDADSDSEPTRLIACSGNVTPVIVLVTETILERNGNRSIAVSIASNAVMLAKLCMKLERRQRRADARHGHRIDCGADRIDDALRRRPGQARNILRAARNTLIVEFASDLQVANTLRDAGHDDHPQIKDRQP